MTAWMPGAESHATPGAKSVAHSGGHWEASDFADDPVEEAGQPASRPAKSKSQLRKGVSLPSRPRGHSGEYRYFLTPRLTDRDVEIVRAVWRLSVFTSDQLCDMFFDTRKRGLVRLRQLWEMGVLDRFRPYREGWGSAPYHYVLGREGAAMAAAWTGEDVDKAVRRYRGAFGVALGRSGVLARSVAVSGFYARLAAVSRANPRCRILDWQRPEEVEAWAHNSISEAWFGEWQQEGRVEQFFLIPDRHRPVSDLLAELGYKFDHLEHGRGEHAHVILLCRSWDRADLVTLTQRRELDLDPKPLKAGEDPIHNRYRVLGPGQDPLEVLLPQEGVCPWTSKGGAWRFDRTIRGPKEIT